jgi:acyl-CoA reductase-like NAD-dependent aldehyde dehydrogenase
LLIDGKEDPGSGTFDVVSAKTGKVCWKAGSSSPEDAVRAVEAVQKAFPSWSKTKTVEKQRILIKAAGLLASRKLEYVPLWKRKWGAIQAQCSIG